MGVVIVILMFMERVEMIRAKGLVEDLFRPFDLACGAPRDMLWSFMLKHVSFSSHLLNGEVRPDIYGIHV